MFLGKDRRTREYGFWKDMRTKEHVFLKDRRTREHEKKGKGLIEQNENKRFGWALPNTPFLRFPHLNHWILHFSLFVLDLNHWILHSSFFTFHLTIGFFTLHFSLLQSSCFKQSRGIRSLHTSKVGKHLHLVLSIATA